MGTERTPFRAIFAPMNHKRLFENVFNSVDNFSKLENLSNCALCAGASAIMKYSKWSYQLKVYFFSPFVEVSGARAINTFEKG